MLHFLVTVTMHRQEANFLLVDVSAKNTLTKFNWSTHGHFQNCLIEISPISLTEYQLLKDSVVTTFHYGKHDAVEYWSIVGAYPKLDYSDNSWKQIILK